MAGLLTPQRQTAGNGLLDQAPRRVDDRVAGLLGLDPSIQRGAILPFGRDASGEMVMAWPEMAIDTLKSLMLPGHVMQGGEFTPRDVTEMALDVGMLSSVAPAPAGAKRMFGGISAKNAPLDDLAKAEAMEKAGAAADDIWRATGWGRGAEGKWRFEIDDSTAKAAFDKPEGVLGDYLDHSQLRSNYPDVADIETEFRHIGGRHFGQYYGGEGGESIAVATSGNPGKSSLLHETQHALQKREGFAKGGNQFGIPPGSPAFEIYKERINAILTPPSIEDYARSAGFDSIDEAAPSYAEFVKDINKMKRSGVPPMLDRAAQDYAVQEAYRRNAGEVEARNVQKRMDMDAATRRATPPWATEDVPRDQQIVRGLLSDRRAADERGRCRWTKQIHTGWGIILSH
jgi:hypothetical protein